LKGWVSSGFRYHSLYEYDLSDKTDFCHLNLEQQAHMVEDYFSDRENLKNWSDSDSLRAAMQADKDKLEQKIKQAIPLPAVPTLAPSPPSPPQS
jgi:hypothetical protein